MIYGYVLNDEPSPHLSYCYPPSKAKVKGPPIAQILQLKHEVLPEWYKRWKVYIYKSSNTRNFALEAWLSAAGDHVVSCLRHLRLNIRGYIVTIQFGQAAPAFEFSGPAPHSFCVSRRKMKVCVQTLQQTEEDVTTKDFLEHFAQSVARQLEAVLVKRATPSLSADDIIMLMIAWTIRHTGLPPASS